jgi:hypothetical protein
LCHNSRRPETGPENQARNWHNSAAVALNRSIRIRPATAVTAPRKPACGRSGRHPVPTEPTSPGTAERPPNVGQRPLWYCTRLPTKPYTSITPATGVLMTDQRHSRRYSRSWTENQQGDRTAWLCTTLRGTPGRQTEPDPSRTPHPGRIPPSQVWNHLELSSRPVKA